MLIETVQVSLRVELATKSPCSHAMGASKHVPMPRAESRDCKARGTAWLVFTGRQFWLVSQRVSSRASSKLLGFHRKEATYFGPFCPILLRWPLESRGSTGFSLVSGLCSAGLCVSFVLSASGWSRVGFYVVSSWFLLSFPKPSNTGPTFGPAVGRPVVPGGLNPHSALAFTPTLKTRRSHQIFTELACSPLALATVSQRVRETGSCCPKLRHALRFVLGTAWPRCLWLDSAVAGKGSDLLRGVRLTFRAIFMVRRLMGGGGWRVFGGKVEKTP